MAINAADFEYMRGMLRCKSGIVLEDGKEYLVDARLTTLARQQKLENASAVIARLRQNSLDPLHRLAIEAMTTNETSFFRDLHPFIALKTTVLPVLLSSRAASRTLNLWCGAASTGQEPYTIAMTLADSIPRLSDWRLSFIATDISAEMIARSRAGKYDQIEVNRGLPADSLVKHFDRHGLGWQIKEPLRKMIDFREMNLITPWPAMPPMDIIFMRNVLIYFDAETKQNILRRVRQVLKPDGYLFLGCAETTLCLDDAYERLPIEKSGCYRLRTAIAKAA